MLALVARALLSGAMIVAIAEIGKRLPAMAAGCALTVALYLLMMHFGPRLGLKV